MTKHKLTTTKEDNITLGQCSTSEPGGLRQTALVLLQLPGYSIQHSPCSAGPRSEVAPAQSLGTLCCALQCTGYLLELGIERNYLEFVVLPKAITLTEYRAYIKWNFCITFPVITGLCGHSI